MDPDLLDDGKCFSLCLPDAVPPTCAASQLCATLDASPLVGVCLDVCNPLLGDCPEDEGCSPFSDRFLCAWTVIDPGAPGEACETLSGCQPGSACVQAERLADCPSSSCCTSYCDTADVESCVGSGLGETCMPWFGDEAEVPLELATLGVCGVSHE